MHAAALLPPVRSVAERTPPGRDRVIDAVRGVSLVVVVFGHLLMLCVYWPQDGHPVAGNLMAAYPNLQYLTWLLQVMPIFFAFGGASSIIAWRKADAGDVLYSSWMWSRVRRLLRPVLVYFAVMGILSLVVAVVAGPTASDLLGVVSQPLWFLGVYLLTLLFLPAMWWVHQRNRAIAFVVLIPIAAAVSVGVTVLGWPQWIGMLNFLLVWLTIQQLGLFWGEGTRRATWVLVALVALGINFVLVYYGPWPMSLVGLPGDVLDYDQITVLGRTFDVAGFHGEYSNMAPPSIVLLLHGFTLVSLVFIARPWLERLLHRPRVWRATTAVMMTSMSLYIWHLLALVAAVATLHLLGFPPPTRLTATGFPEPTSTGAYLTWFALLLLVFLLYLSVLVLLTWSTEFRHLPVWDDPPRGGVLPLDAPGWLYVTCVVISGTLVGLGLLVVALAGFAGFPYSGAEYGGVKLNAGIAMLVMLAGAMTMRSLTRQPLVPSAADGQPHGESGAALGGPPRLGGAA
jgi:hypothetical protein